MRSHESLTSNSAGAVTATSLPDAGYDITITISDGNGNTAEGKLTVTVTGKPQPFASHLGILLSVAYICKQFGPRSGPTERRA